MITRKSPIKRLKFNPTKLTKGIKRRSKFFGYKIKNEEIKSIWEKYLQIKKIELLSKGSTTIGSKVGTLSVYRIDSANLSGVVKINVERARSENISRVGKYYFITLESNREKVMFRANQGLKDRLTEILKTDKEYKAAPLKYHKIK